MPNTESLSFLVYGYGNPGRSDDGLGVKLAEKISACGFTYVDVDINYQLNAEDSLKISQKDIVIFADASKKEFDKFRLTPVIPSNQIGFTTHAMKAGSVLALCKELYNKIPDAYLLEIKGYKWEMGEVLSQKGNENLDKACEFMSDLLKSRDRKAFKNASD